MTWSAQEGHLSKFYELSDNLKEAADVAKLVILYGQPEDPSAFEDYYANRHIPYATDHMPNVIGAENLRVIESPGAEAPPYYRVPWLAYASISELHAGIDSHPGRAVLADLENFATGGATILVCEEG